MQLKRNLRVRISILSALIIDYCLRVRFRIVYIVQNQLMNQMRCEFQHHQFGDFMVMQVQYLCIERVLVVKVLRISTWRRI